METLIKWEDKRKIIFLLEICIIVKKVLYLGNLVIMVWDNIFEIKLKSDKMLLLSLLIWYNHGEINVNIKER